MDRRTPYSTQTGSSNDQPHDPGRGPTIVFSELLTRTVDKDDDNLCADGTFEYYDRVHSGEKILERTTRLKKKPHSILS